MALTKFSNASVHLAASVTQHSPLCQIDVLAWAVPCRTSLLEWVFAINSMLLPNATLQLYTLNNCLLALVSANAFLLANLPNLPPLESACCPKSCTIWCQLQTKHQGSASSMLAGRLHPVAKPVVMVAPLVGTWVDSGCCCCCCCVASSAHTGTDHIVHSLISSHTGLAW